MDWTIQIANQRCNLKLPDRIVDGIPFHAILNGKKVKAHINGRLSTLFIQEPDSELERSIRFRSFRKTDKADTGETLIHLELSSGSRQPVTYVKAILGPDIPGQSERKRQQANRPTPLKSPMTGKVLAVLVEEGQEVDRDAPLMVVEAMKMENKITAPSAGTVTKLACKPGDAVNVGVTLLVIEPIKSGNTDG